MTILFPFNSICLANRNLIVQIGEKGVSIDGGGPEERRKDCDESDDFHFDGAGL